MEIVRNPHFRKPLGEWDVHTVADCLLMALWQCGFKVVKLNDVGSKTDPPSAA